MYGSGVTIIIQIYHLDGFVVSSDSESDSEFSSSSLDDRSLLTRSKAVKIKNQEETASRGEVTRTSTRITGRPLGSTLSESQSSLGSERGGVLSTTESCPSDLQDEDSDASRSTAGLEKEVMSATRERAALKR
ncbi:UNVERIFIED_CONTAM: hypothetical protein K2H54_033292 [Gekko kuhli]